MYCIAQSWENLIFSWKAHNEILFGIQCIDLQRIIVYKRPGKKLKRDSAEYFHFMLCLSGTCSPPNVSSIISTLSWMQNHVSFQIYLSSCWFVFGTSKNVCLGIWFSSVWRVCTVYTHCLGCYILCQCGQPMGKHTSNMMMRILVMMMILVIWLWLTVMIIVKMVPNTSFRQPMGGHSARKYLSCWHLKAPRWEKVHRRLKGAKAPPFFQAPF